jgi:membrane-bound serine protease (ClpP class)
MGLVLLGLAFLLLAAEVFVPSFGILGVSGVIALVVGADMVIESAGPNAPIDWGIVSGVLVVVLTYFGLSAWIGYRILRRKGSLTGMEGLMGEEAEIVEWADREGLVRVQGELWQAVSERHHPDFTTGKTVQISDHHDLKLKIRISE